jgi:hypothetical protein
VKNLLTNVKNYFAHSYYDIKESKHYIITGNYKCARSYDFNSNLLYHNYIDGYEDNKSFNYEQIHNLMINDKEEIIKLIECDYFYIRIWNFHKGILLMKIYINEIENTSICLWNKDFLFIGSSKKILLINIKYGMIVDEILGHNGNVICIQKIIHPKFGQCLISQGSSDNYIILRSVN